MKNCDRPQNTSRLLGDRSICCSSSKCLSCIHRDHYKPPEISSCIDRLHQSVLFPPQGNLAFILTSILALILFWLCLYSIVGCKALPGGHFFALLSLIICSIIGGKLVSFVKLPPLLGILIVGFTLRNVPVINVAVDLDQSWASSLRSIALVVILTRAGLGLDPEALKRLSFVCFRLAFTPCLVEAAFVAISSHILLDFPWLWALMLGFVLSAVSPAVVVPSMIAIQEKGLGRDKGIPTLVIAASSIDDVLAISGFGIILGITFTQGSLGWALAKGPIEVIIGLTYGIFLGFLLWFLPSDKQEGSTAYRFIMLFCGGLVAVFGSRVIDFGGAGALACLVLSFVAGYGWRQRGWFDDTNPVSELFGKLWLIFQPILFGLIGAEITIENLDPNTTGLGIAVLCIGLTFRIATSFFVVMGAGLNIKERLFIAFAWLPKATVQAAIGPVALDYARQIGNPRMEFLGQQVLTVAVLVILITAPIGAAAISVSAPKLLTGPISDSEAESKSYENYQGYDEPPEQTKSDDECSKV